MTLREFHNGLRIMASIDRDELEQAIGYRGALANQEWLRFRTNPWREFIRMSDADAKAVWSIIKRRQA